MISAMSDRMSSDHSHGFPYTHHASVNDHSPGPGYMGHPLQQTLLIRGNSDTSFHGISPQQPLQGVTRANSDVIKQPQPVPVGPFTGQNRGRVQWNLGSES